LTSEGYEVVFSLVKNAIERAFPGLAPDRMLSSMPDYSEFGPNGQDDLIKQCQESYGSISREA
jgi:hypothetical protein